MALLRLVCSLLVFVCVIHIAFGQGGYQGRRRGGVHIVRCPQVICSRFCEEYVYDSSGCRTCTCRHRAPVHLPHQPRARCPPNNIFTPCVVGPNQCSSDSQCGHDQICCPRGCNRECVYPVGHVPHIRRPTRRRQRNRTGRRRTGGRWPNPRY